MFLIAILFNVHPRFEKFYFAETLIAHSADERRVLNTHPKKKKEKKPTPSTSTTMLNNNMKKKTHFITHFHYLFNVGSETKNEKQQKYCSI